MESHRTLIEAYISARFPASAVCGVNLALPYLVNLYPYEPYKEARHLAALLQPATARAAFNRLVVPEVEQLAAYVLGNTLPAEPAESLFVHLRTCASPTLVKWLDGDDDEEQGATLAGAFELLHEVLVSVYINCDERAFDFWFNHTKSFHGDEQANYQIAPFMEAYLAFLTETEPVSDILPVAA